MSIQRVTCSRCGNTMNVAASMGSVKCSSCGDVFSTSGEVSGQEKLSGQGSATSPNPYRSNSRGDRAPARDGAKQSKAIIIGATIAVGCVILCGIVASRAWKSVSPAPNSPAPNSPATAVTNETSAPPVEVAQEKRTTETSEANAAPEAVEYRIVKRSEAQRKRLYRDYRTMEKSMGRNASKVPSSGVAGVRLGEMLGKTADREIEMMALQNNLTADDIRQIIAEGRDKNWIE